MSTNLWRNRYDRSENDESDNTMQFALKKGIVGVGWEVEAKPGESLNWEEYEDRAKQSDYPNQEAWVRSITAIHENMNEDDLCYTRNTSGQFYLGRVTGPWRYETDPEHQQHELVNVRDCNWYRIKEPEETVPTELLESFGRGAGLQRVKDPRLLAFTQRLFELIDDEDHYDIELPNTLDHWLSDDDLKDLLALHLQTDEDQILIPSTVDQRPFLADGIAVNRVSAERTLYQVQHQHDNLPQKAYQNDERRIVYLKRDSDSPDTLPNNVQVLQLEDLVSVFENQWDLLPRRLRIIGSILRKHGTLAKTQGVTSTDNSRSDDDESPVPVGFTVRNAIYLFLGFLLGLAFMTSYGQSTSSSNNPTGQQQQMALKTEIRNLNTQNKNLIAERNELKRNLAEIKSEAEKSEGETIPNSESQWINVRVQADDTLSELLARFQGSQQMQNEVVKRNNLRDRDLIYPGSTLSLPSNTTDRPSRIAQN